MKEFHWRDKSKHLIISFIISFGFLVITDSLPYTLGVIVLLTFIKEAFDRFKKNKDTLYHSFLDAMYNLIGLFLAYVFYNFLLNK